MNEETKPVVFARDGHPEELQLLLTLERELPPLDAARVEQHMGNCWSCRARFDEMQRGILAFVEYREKRYLPLLEAPPETSNDFRASLRNVVGESKPDRWTSRLWRRLFTLSALPRQVKWVSAMAAVMALVIFWLQVLVNPRVMSGNELLTRAVRAQNPVESTGTIGRPRIVHQTMQIRSGKQTVVREFQWRIGKPIIAARWDLQPDPLKWNAPMTAEGFAIWRSNLQQKADTVKRAGDILTLDTITTGQSAIKEAWLTVRVKDFHPIEQHVRFTDNRQLDFSELSFQVGDEVQNVQSMQKPAPRVTSALKSSGPASLSRAVNLDDVELNLRYTLFAHKWDLGEDLAVTRVAGKVVLSGIVSSTDREEAMRATLGALPSVRFSVQRPATSVDQTLSPTSKDRPTSAPALLRDSLENSFSSRADRLAFVDECLAESDDAVSQAWALKRLVERYSDAQEQLLAPESDEKLHQMIAAHLLAIGRSNRGLDALLALLPSSNTDTIVTAPDWRGRLQSLIELVQEQDRLVAVLLASAKTEGQNIVTASANFRTAHASITALLDRSKELIGDRIVK